MKRIKLTKGKYAIVDDEDYPLLSRHKWQYNTSNVSTCHTTWLKNKSPYQMQDWIISKKPFNKIMFKNRNSLDFRKSNLAEVHRGTPEHYGFKRKGKWTSKYKGVCWDKRDCRWLMQITYRKKALREYFRNEIDAANAYNKKARELYGKFAYQNKI